MGYEVWARDAPSTLGGVETKIAEIVTKSELTTKCGETPRCTSATQGTTTTSATDQSGCCSLRTAPSQWRARALICTLTRRDSLHLARSLGCLPTCEVLYRYFPA